MTVTVPVNHQVLYTKQAEVTAIAATVAATTSGPHLAVALQKQYQLNAELVDALMAAGRLSPLTILSTCTYNT
jgi:hypothetical protein